METAAETEAALTGTFLNRSFGESFFVIWGKLKRAKKQNISTKMIEQILPQLSFGRHASGASSKSSKLLLEHGQSESQNTTWSDQTSQSFWHFYIFSFDCIKKSVQFNF